jgi:poly(3-hydroxyalkanoate) synthetase
MEAVANFHEEIEKIKGEFGFQFTTSDYELVHETDTFLMYQILPIKEGVKVRNELKPVLLIPPYMLGVHILGFLPFENKSYAHSFANEGIPTYVRVIKDIMTTEAVQNTTPEADCLGTVELCAKLAEKHGQKVTLNGTCQGGYIALLNVLSGKLADSCDTLITNVAPIDGTYSEGVAGMPTLHSDFVTETLPNGNKVANGFLLSLGIELAQTLMIQRVSSVVDLGLNTLGALLGAWLARRTRPSWSGSGSAAILPPHRREGASCGQDQGV